MLKKDSETDTDDDGLHDWTEVNTEAIYTVKENLPENEGGDKELRKKPYLLMSDMPTIYQCKTYYGKDFLYVESGFERFKDEHNADKMTAAELEEFLNWYHITPIWSCPVDADSDNDGVIDPYDSKPLDRYSVELNEKGEAEGKDSVFTVLEVIEELESVTITKKTNTYSYPNGKMVDIYLSDNDKIVIHSVLYAKGKYWLKIIPNNRFLSLYVCIDEESTKYDVSNFKFDIMAYSDFCENFPTKYGWGKNYEDDVVEHNYYNDGVTSGSQCYGFALKLFYEIWKQPAGALFDRSEKSKNK